MSISVIQDLQRSEKDAWISIYESKQTKKLLSGTISAVEPHDNSYCHVVFFEEQIKVLIPASVKGGMEAKDDVQLKKIMYAMLGAKVEFIVEAVDRENELVVASRAKALEVRKKELSRIAEGDKIKCDVVAVGKGSVIVVAAGVEMRLRYRDITWTYETDLRNIVSVGNELDCIVTKIDAEADELMVSIKLATPDPYRNLERKYRQNGEYIGTVSLINEKYVFVRLPDGVDARCPHPGWTNMRLNNYDKVQIRIRKINAEKRHVVALIERLIERSHKIG